jgi:hypothetical protein
MKKLRGCLGVFLIFLLGALFGTAITAGGIHQKVREIVLGGPDKVVDEIVHRLNDDLKLDRAQKEMLKTIATDTRIKLRAIRQQTQPQVEEALHEAEARVRGILNPHQVSKFEEIVKRGREQWKDKEPAKAAEPNSKSGDREPSQIDR